MMIEITCPATYPADCKLVFVGEAPGSEEESWHICPQCARGQGFAGSCLNCKVKLHPAPQGFVGASGRCLQKAALLANLKWNAVGRSNVAKRRPPNNKFRDAFYETTEEPLYTKTGKLSKRTDKITRKTAELLQWENLLALELREHNPNLVVAVGNEALEALTGLTGVTNYRGSVVESREGISRPDGSPFKVLAVEHPAYILRGNFRDFWILAHDLKKAHREMKFPEIKREPWVCFQPRDYTPGEHKNQILWLLGILRYRPKLKWTLDVETRAGTLACFAIGYYSGSDWVAFTVPIQTTTGPYWSSEDEWEIWHALDATAQANPNLCNQNIEYDIYYLLRYGVEPSGVYMDTMLAHSILYPEFPKGLDFLASFYLDDVVYWKQDHRDWSKSTPDEALWAYCAKDAIYTRRIVDKIDEELRHRGMYEFYHGKNG